jgi:release factor glutamine methyltransferase
VTTIGAALAAAARRLGESGSQTPGLDARLLMEWAAGWEAARLISASQDELRANVAERFRRAVAERAGGRPVARIVGSREFWGLDFELGDETLVPRPDTETLVGSVLSRVEAPRSEWRGRICDLGTGSGAILVTLLSELPAASGVGVDLSTAAIDIARRNGERHGVTGRVDWLCGDYTEVPRERFDILVANPPYVATAEISGLALEVRAHDPHLALDGGSDGLDAYRTIAARLPQLIHPGGLVALELGVGQADSVAQLTSRHGLDSISVDPDIAGIPRVLVGWYGSGVAPMPQT